MHRQPEPDAVSCYAQRMLSPFRGLMHLVATRWADAVTTDGRNWTLYVRGECLYEDPDDLQQAAIAVPDVKYGTWSARSGFRRAPIRLPTFDDRVRLEGNRLLAAVHRHATELPFPLADRFELWLLHGDTGLPLALIDSRCNAGECEPAVNARWTSGQSCRTELREARALEAAVEGLAGRRPQAQWYERHADGGGSVHGTASGGPAPGTRLPADRFPTLFVDERALDPAQRLLLAALHRWQAPALLSLPGLGLELRARFESAACQHALRLAEQYALYPCVIDRQAMNAALVEARLRRSGAATTPSDDAGSTLSPDYIEIPD